MTDYNARCSNNSFESDFLQKKIFAMTTAEVSMSSSIPTLKDMSEMGDDEEFEFTFANIDKDIVFSGA